MAFSGRCLWYSATITECLRLRCWLPSVLHLSAEDIFERRQFQPWSTVLGSLAVGVDVGAVMPRIRRIPALGWRQPMAANKVPSAALRDKTVVVE